MTTSAGEKDNNIKGKRRINFREPVRRLLKDEAGGLCCFGSCLRVTNGTTTNEQGKAKSAGIGVAAHVYAAAERGPRPPGDLTEEQIRSPENGLWMCASCGELVDDFQALYPAEDLLRMKAVRALAHDIALHDSTIGMFVNLVGVRPWNDLVASRVAELHQTEIKTADRAPIKEAFMSQALERLAAIELAKRTSHVALPERFVKSAIADVLSNMGMPPQMDDSPAIPMAIRRDGTAYAGDTWAELRSAAHNMATSWWRSVKGELVPNKWLIAESQVLLAVKHPETKEIYNPGFILSVTLYALFRYTVDGGEQIDVRFRHAHNRNSEIGWNAGIALEPGSHHYKSSLTQTQQYDRGFLDNHEPSEHKFHKELLTRLIAGWKPIVYYSLSTDTSEQSPLDHLHREPLSVECDIPVKTLQHMLARCLKIDAAIAFQQHWNAAFDGAYMGHRVLCDSDYLSDQATPELIEEAFFKLCAIAREHRFEPELWKVGPLFMYNRKIGAFLQYRDGVLSLARRVVTNLTG